MPVTKLRQARITTELGAVQWDRWPVVVDVGNGTIRLESKDHVDEEWTGLTIEKSMGGRMYTAQHPELGTITIAVQRGCTCHSPSRTDKRGRPV